MLAVLWAAPARARDSSVATVIEVDAGALRALRLDRLAAGARIELSLFSRRPIAIYLMDEAAFARLPRVQGTLLTGLVSGRMELRISVPREGDYFVVFDNRANRDRREVTLSIRISTAEKPASSPVVTMIGRG